ncbi:CD209 antigen [Orycteropus afer afer]|uniref:CD209 antigen n=1 Tax=Orycteropus afer afer TaxID=1230840 RepID=A0A8B7AZS3_ORYAF|nr:CD209 antigen [Orycteropus afer afer]
MEEMYDSESPDSSAPSSAAPAGCLTRVSLPLLLLLVSLGLFFVLLVTTQVQVARIHQILQRETQGHQSNCNLDAISKVPGSQEQIQALMRSEEELHQLKASVASLCRPCPWEWQFFQGNCYFFSRTQQSWQDAASACKNDGTQLVIINSEMEQKFLQFWDIRKNQRTWTGLSDHHNEGSWRWVDNTPLQLSFWNDGEPNNHGDEDCMELIDEGWNDNKCNVKNFWICEKPAAHCPNLYLSPPPQSLNNCSCPQP